MLQVIEPGLLTTVQDGGRPGLAHLGVPESGACDPWSLRLANALLGNPATAPCLEMTLLGPELEIVADSTIGLAGADLGASSTDIGPLGPGASYRLRRGARIRFDGPATGVRAYLALPGGIDVPKVFGSTSTYLPGRLGGIDGRALAAGDRIAPAGPDHDRLTPRRLPDDLIRPLSSDGPARVRVLPGPHPDRFADDALEVLCERTWEIHPRSDRMGIRLTGDGLETGGAGMVSQAMVWGAVQVPPDGQPIVLLADHQTVGGYPVIAVAIAADRGILGQLGPGDVCRFEVTTETRAREALIDQAARLARLGATWAAA